MNTKMTVIHHSADFDGIFCREIARKFLPDAELIGWDFGDAPLIYPPEGAAYVLDLPVDRVFGIDFRNDGYKPQLERCIWIDHHKSAIESHPITIPGYRIDGVAACRLAWQYFTRGTNCPGCPACLVPKESFIERIVREPLAIRLAGEYDIWDKRDPNAELFQHALRSQKLTEMEWPWLLADDDTFTRQLLAQGKVLQYAKQSQDASIILHQGFDLEWEGLRFLALNSARCNSLSFAAGVKPEHDALLAFKWTGGKWMVSLYHAPGKEHHDLSVIAVKYGGGGHRGACGFVCTELPFPLAG